MMPCLPHSRNHALFCFDTRFTGIYNEPAVPETAPSGRWREGSRKKSSRKKTFKNIHPEGDHVQNQESI